ncbi:MAG: hypothetical protein AAFQ77_03310 [Myxococcota bacterium]
MKRSMRSGVLLACLVTGSVGCSGSGGEGKHLKAAVDDYHANLRWKRLNEASNYRATERRAEFLARYLAVEDDLSIDTIEVRGVTFVPDSQPPAADVVISAEAYLLPSAILKKHVITEHWELDGERWLLVSTSAELAPELEPSEKSDKNEIKPNPTSPSEDDTTTIDRIEDGQASR